VTLNLHPNNTSKTLTGFNTATGACFCMNDGREKLNDNFCLWRLDATISAIIPPPKKKTLELINT